jgi:hypothetical protein
MGIESFPGVKSPGRGVDHPHSYTIEVKEIVELYSYSFSGLSGVNFSFNFFFYRM